MDFDFSAFLALEQTADGNFISGENGVDKILTPIDRKSEFIFMGKSIFVRIYSNMHDPVLYQLKEPVFQPKAEAILMDLDGTSVQSEEFWIWIIQRTMQQLIGNSGFQLSEEDIPFVSGFSVSEHLQYCIDKYAPEQKIEQARRLYHEITAYEMDEILKGRGNQHAFRPAKHLKEFLLALKREGIKIGLVTSGLYTKAMPEIVAAFRTLQLGNPLEFYDAIITAGQTFVPGKQSGTLGELCAKPHPWLYAETAQVGLGVSEESTGVLGIEDSSAGVLSVALAGYPVIGMEGGNIHAAGLDGILYRKSHDLLDVLNCIL